MSRTGPAQFAHTSASALQHRYVASLILHASIAKIAAQLLSLSYV